MKESAIELRQTEHEQNILVTNGYTQHSPSSCPSLQISQGENRALLETSNGVRHVYSVDIWLREVGM